MTIGTYMSKEEKERQDREEARFWESIRKTDNEKRQKKMDEYLKEKESDKKSRTQSNMTLPLLAFAILGITTLSKLRSEYNNLYQTKSNGIENAIKLEYQTEEAKLKSAYKLKLKEMQSGKMKVDSIYNAKVDSLQKVYENKLEKELK